MTRNLRGDLRLSIREVPQQAHERVRPVPQLRWREVGTVFERLEEVLGIERHIGVVEFDVVVQDVVLQVGRLEKRSNTGANDGGNDLGFLSHRRYNDSTVSSTIAMSTILATSNPRVVDVNLAKITQPQSHNLF